MASEPAVAPSSLLPLLSEGKPDARGWLPRRVVMAGLLAILLAVPALSETTLEFVRADWISLGLIYVMVGISINILIGYLGQVSLGHQAFVGVGAFTSAYMVSNTGLNFWAAIVFAAATGALAALGLGVVALRLKGLYLALITLAYGEIAERVLFSIPRLTGGGAGSQAPRPPGFEGEKAYVYLCLGFVTLLFFVDWRMMQSKAGRAILAIRENEIAAASFGINVVAYKLLAFVTSGAFAGIAGALLAHRRTVVVSVDFSFTLALTFVLMVVVGGLGSRPGIFLGSMFFAIFPLAANKLTIYVPAIGAGLLLFTLTLNPGGIAQQIRPITDWLAGRPFSLKHHDEGVATGGAGVRP
jgi:branched-chain amino acid transport system permease protein